MPRAGVVVKVQLNQHVAIATKDDASDRTRSRVSEHGANGFIVRDHLKSHRGLAGGPALLVESLVDGPRRGDRWIGWLPLDEIAAIGPWGV